MTQCDFNERECILNRKTLFLFPYHWFNLFIFTGAGEPSRKELRGPVFRNEPPSRVEFSNSSGTELRCNADAVPAPRLSWQTREGGNTRDVPGLRYIRSDGTLVFPPFARTDYSQEVHDTVYQCLASNTVGSIISREVHVRGGKLLSIFTVKI